MSDIFIFLVPFLIVGIYFLPAILAYKQKKLNAGSVLLLNFLLGWTIIGWVVALIWGSTKDANPAQHGTTTDELEKLAALKERGVLSEEEFLEKKKSILA